MGKGKQQQVPTDSIVRQTNLPEYADPYFRRMLQGAEEVTMPFDPETGRSTYIPYQGERIAPSEMYGDIQGSRAMVRGLAESGIYGMPEAMGAARLGMGYQDEAIQGLRGLANYGTGQFDPYSGFEAQQVDPFAGFEQARATPTMDQFQEFNPNQYQGFREAEFSPFGEFDQFQFRGPEEFSEFNFRPDYQFEGFQYQEPERFSGGAVQDYMSPYMQSVVDQQKSQAQLDFERQGASRAAQAVQAGAFGGSRQAVQESLAEEALGRQMGDIQARGSQAAFEQAAQQFGLDRAARMETERAQAGEFARVQAGSAAEQARVDQARFTELASREQAQAAEFARAGDQASAEAARVQASKFQDLARIQAGKASEMGRVQGAQASENARMDAIMQQEMARVQQSRAGEQARLDDFMRSEMGRTQDAEARELARVQGISVDEARRIQQSEADELARVQQAVEQSRQFGSGQGLAAYQAMGSGAGQLAGLGAGLAGLGERQRAADIQGTQLLETIGRDIRSEDQARLDMAYEDFRRQRDYPISQYERMAAILRGIPVTPNVEEQRFASYNPTQQALGAGISALGLYRGLTA
jgi:hypothetical protein